MGLSQSKDSSQDPTLEAQLFDQTGNCKFYRTKSGQEFEKYQVQNDNQSDFENRYEFRIKNPSPYLVNALYAQPIQNNFGCTSQNEFSVVVQRIKERLSTIHNLPSSQALNITHKSLKGFEQLYKSNGILLVKDDMIGINTNNQVKVWLHSNFSLNYSEPQPLSYKMLTLEDKQSIMVDNVIELINSRTRRQPLWKQFMDNKYYKGKLSFKQAIVLVQQYAEMKQIPFEKSITLFDRNPQSTIIRQSQLIKNNSHKGIQRINSKDSSSFLKRSPATKIQSFDRQKTHTSLEGSKSLKEQEFNVKPMGITNPIQEDPNKKGGNLTMIRHKIMSGTQQPPSQFTQLRGNIKNIPLNENNFIRQNNFSPTPSQIQRSNGFVHQYPVHVEPKLYKQSPNKGNQPIYNRPIEQPKPMDSFSSFNFSQSGTLNKPLSQPTPYNPNFNSYSLNYSHSTNKDFQTTQFQVLQSEKPKSNGVNMHIEDKKVENLSSIISNPFDLISSNQIYRIVSNQEKTQPQEKNHQNEEPIHSQLTIVQKISIQQLSNQINKEETKNSQKEQVAFQESQVQIQQNQSVFHTKESQSREIFQQQEERQNHQEQQKIYAEKQIKSQQKGSRVDKIEEKQEKIEKQKIEEKEEVKKVFSHEEEKTEIEKDKVSRIEEKGMGSSNLLSSSKMCLKSSSGDLKGMISYKDLRNLLRSTKQQKYD